MRNSPIVSRRNFLGGTAAISLLGSLRIGSPGQVFAAEQPDAAEVPHGGGYYRFKIGEFKATVIADGYGTVPFWPVLAANQEAAAVQNFLTQNHISPQPQFSNNLLVVDTPADRILVDTGFGDVLGPKSGHFPWLVQNLERAGITTDSITAVIITHVHLDHVAGILNKEGDFVFPNARYIIVDDELTYWTGDRWEADINASKAPDQFKQAAIFAAKTYIPPIKNRMEVVRPGSDIVSGISLIPAPGHSPAHTAIRLSSGNEQLIHMADVAHRPDSGLQHPEWSVIFDYDGDQGIATRKRILGEVAADRIPVLGYHFPFPALGYVEPAGSAYRWNPLSWSW